ncbi:MAG: hypothetical protein QXI16_00055 [Sulfolobaceae archaeon]
MYELYKGSPEEVTSEETTTTLANVAVPILVFQVPAQTSITFPEIVRVIAQLYNSSGSLISNNATLSIVAKKAGAVQPSPVSSEKTLSAWNALTLEQQNDNKHDNVILMDANYMFTPFTTIYVMLKDVVSETLSWTNSQFILRGLTKSNY